MTHSPHSAISSNLLAFAAKADARAALALEACRLGGDVLLGYWERLAGSDVSEKSSGDLVTRADLDSERVISNFLLERMPEAGVICEEGTARAGDRLHWHLDPLDGTTNFVQRFPIFAVSLALVETLADDASRIHCGVVYNPVSGEVFWGVKGKGSYLQTARLAVSSKDRFQDAVIATGFPRRHGSELAPYLLEFGSIYPQCRAIRRAGAAALDLCWTAQGIFDGFWEHRLCSWDIAAGALIVSEAGGVCTDFRGEQKFMTSGNIVGAPPKIHAELLRHIQHVARA